MNKNGTSRCAHCEVRSNPACGPDIYNVNALAMSVVERDAAGGFLEALEFLDPFGIASSLAMSGAG
jgi:hypothetical protein